MTIKHPVKVKHQHFSRKQERIKALLQQSQQVSSEKTNHTPSQESLNGNGHKLWPHVTAASNGDRVPAEQPPTVVEAQNEVQIASPVATPATAPAASNGAERPLEYVTSQMYPGNRYFRYRFSDSGITQVSDDEQKILLAPELETGSKPFFHRLSQVLIGKPISTENAIHERIGKFKALALLSSDALSSVAYGTEASLAILVTAGLGLGMVNLWIGLSIIVLLAVVAFSYRQTILNYPTGGGSYIVAKAHLGETAGLIAAAALLLDYILTVSVSVSAGVNAIVSTFGLLTPFTVELGLVFIGLIVIINLRGVRESGSIFAIPTYLFVGSYLLTIVVGLVRAALAPGGLLAALPERATDIGHTQQLGIFLVLTAFASGCSAMTGTEAIADGVPVFTGTSPKQQSKNAAATLIIMATLLGIMYSSTTYLAWRFGITPRASGIPTVLSLIAQYIWGIRGFGYLFFVLFQFATTLILILAANTSFSDFPRLSSILARDDFMPHFFGLRGGRLAFNVGIMVLGVLSGALLWFFDGKTDALINLYALGVFTAFTLSQSGMVMRFRKEHDAGWRHGAIISGFGAFVTGIVTLIIAISKTERGAWVVLILIPLLVFMFKGIHRHYANIQQIVAAMEVRKPSQIHHLIVVPIAALDHLALRGLAYARSITPHIVAVHVTQENDNTEQLRANWNDLIKNKKFLRGGPIFDEDMLEEDTPQHRESLKSGPELVIIESPYRVLERPLIRYIDKLHDEHRNDMITVVLPEFVPNHFWERLLHNQTAFRLKFALLGRSQVVTSNVPYRFMRASEKPPVVLQDAPEIAGATTTPEA